MCFGVAFLLATAIIVPFTAAVGTSPEDSRTGSGARTFEFFGEAVKSETNKQINKQTNNRKNNPIPSSYAANTTRQGARRHSHGFNFFFTLSALA